MPTFDVDAYMTALDARLAMFETLDPGMAFTTYMTKPDTSDLPRTKAGWLARREVGRRQLAETDKQDKLDEERMSYEAG